MDIPTTSRPSTKAKNKYNAKAYDRLNIVVPKGKREELQAHAEKHGESLNGFVNRAISETKANDSVTDDK